MPQRRFEDVDNVKGLTTKEALKKLRDAISQELQQFEAELVQEEKHFTKSNSVLSEAFHHRSHHSSFPWPSALFSLLTCVLLLVCYSQNDDDRYNYVLLEAFILFLITIVNMCIIFFDVRLKHYEVLNKAKYMLKYLDKCIEKCCWKATHYPHLNMPLSPCITLQTTFRDGDLVNLHWSLLVEGDIIRLRQGQIVPARCRPLDDPNELVLNFEDVFATSKDHSFDIFSTPQMRCSDPTKNYILLETPYIRHLRLVLQKSRDRPVSYFVKERYIILVQYIQCTIIPCLVLLMLVVNTVRYFYLWRHVGHWTEMFILLQIKAIVPLLPLAFPICWLILNTYGLALLSGIFYHSKQSQLSCDVHVDDWGETAPSLQLIVDFNWRQLKKNMCEILFGKEQTLCRTSNILHAFGSITTLCCIDKKGILSGPNPTPEKVFFLKAKSGTNSADIIIDEAKRSRERNLDGNQEFVAKVLDNDDFFIDTDDCLRESQVEVLDVTCNNQVPFCVQFDDPRWKRHISNLKPLGLAILLNTCNPKTQNLYADFYSHITCEALHNDVVVPVVSRRCLCELARHIGFTEKALNIFQLQHHLSTFRHLPAEQARRDKLARSLPCSKVRFPFPHMASVVVKEQNTGMSQLMSQGTCDLILDCCNDFWDGQDLQPLTESDRKKILDFYHRTSLTSYCSAFSYRPINAQINENLSKLYLEIPAKNDRLYSYMFSPSPHRSYDKNKWLLSRCLSSDSLLGQASQDQDVINDADSCLEAQCNQVFIGMVAMQYQARTDMVRLIEQLDKACIRFVHFSKENELRSRVFSEKMGLESGWNCHISLLSEKPKSECGTSTKASQISLNRKHQSSIDEILGAIDGTHSPKLRSNLDIMKQLSYSAPSAINLDMNIVKFDDLNSQSSEIDQVDQPLRANTEEMRGTSMSSHEECDITQALIENRGSSAISSRSPSHITESTEQSVPIAFDMSNRAKLPKGIENIRPHLENIDNVPLLVSLFTDCTPDVTIEMIKIMQEYGEIVCCMGSSANIYNISMFIQADASVAIEPLYPQLCVCQPVYDTSFTGFPLPIDVNHRLLSLPCSLDYHQNDPVGIYHLVIEARHFMMAMRNCFNFYLSCSLSLSFMIVLSSTLLIPPPLTFSHILFFVLFTFPLLSMSLIGRPLDEEISAYATPKNIHIITKKDVFGFFGYLGLRFFPSVAIVILCFILTLSSLCLRITNSSQQTCSFLFGNVNFEQPNEWNGWSQTHSYSMSISQNIAAFLMSLYYVCISVNFVHRSHQLWSRSPFQNRFWVITVITVIMFHLTYFAVDLHLQAGRATTLQASLEDVAIEVWIIASVWPVCLITINELVKRHQIKVDVRYQKRARLEFGTKLGMNSPF